jgi:hypothetical protein
MPITIEADLSAIEARIAALPDWEGEEATSQRFAKTANAKGGAQNLGRIREMLSPSTSSGRGTSSQQRL